MKTVLMLIFALGFLSSERNDFDRVVVKKRPACETKTFVDGNEVNSDIPYLKRLESFKITDFENLEPGDYEFLRIDAPYGSQAVLVPDEGTSISVLERDCSWPLHFGDRAIKVDGGSVTLFIAGQVSVLSVDAGNELNSEPNPYITCEIVGYDENTEENEITSIVSIDGRVMPEGWGNMVINPGNGRMLSCKIDASVIDYFVVAY